MASQLAGQLQALQARSLDATRLSTKAKSTPSYLFRPRDAAALSLEEVHQLGHNGFLALLKLARRLEEYEEALFGENAKRTDRALLTADQNKQLDKTLQAVLRVISPLLMLKPSGYLIEWLIRRFRVNELNMSDLLVAFLPYHTTNQFAQILQICDVNQVRTLSELVPVRTSKQPLPRPTLLASMSKDALFLRWVVGALTKYTKRRCAHRALVTFWMSALVGFIDSRDEITENEMSILWPEATAAIAAQNAQDVQLAGMIVASRLLAKVQLQASGLLTFARLLVTSRPQMGENDEAIIVSLVSVLSAQADPPPFDEVIVEGLMGMPSLSDVLHDLAQQHDVSSLMAAILPRLLVLSTEDARAETICSSMAQPQAPAGLQSALLQALLASSSDNDNATALLARFIQSSPLLIESALSAAPSLSAQARLAQAQSVSMSSNPRQAILVGLNSHDTAYRLDSLGKLLEQPDMVTTDELRTTLMARLAEQEPKVTELLLARAEPLLAALSFDDLLAALTPNDDIAVNADAAAALARFAIGPLATRYSSAEQRSLAVATLVLPLLLPSQDSAAGVTAVCQLLSKHSAVLKETCLTHVNSKKIKTSDSVEVLAASIGQALHQPRLVQQASVVALQSPSHRARVLANLALAKASKSASAACLPTLLSHAGRLLNPTIQSSAPAEQIIGNIWSGVIDKHLVASAQMLTLQQFAAHLTPPSSARWCWLAVDIDSDAAQYASFARSLYQHMRTRVHGQEVVASLLSHLREDALAFFAAIWSDVSITKMTRLAAVQDSLAYIEALRLTGVTKDLQMLLPLCLSMGCDADAQLRQASVQLVQAIHASAAISQDLLAADVFYGTSIAGPLLRLDQSSLSKYIDTIIGQAGAIVADATALGASHVELAASAATSSLVKKQILPFLYSHINAIPLLSARISLLTMLRGLKGKHRIESHVKLLKSASAYAGAPELAAYLDSLVSIVSSCSPTTIARSPDLLPLIREALSRATGSPYDSTLQGAVLAVAPQYANKLQTVDRLTLLQATLRARSLVEAALVDLAQTSLRTQVQHTDTLLELLSAYDGAHQIKGRTAKRAKGVASAKASLSQYDLMAALEALDVAKVPEPSRLLSGVLTTLSTVLQQASSTDYDPVGLSQALLNVADALLSRSETTILVPEAASAQVKAVLDVIRAFETPQAIGRALSVVSRLALLVPETVAASIVPIFTFMGANMLNRDDAASVRIVERTIKSVAPALLAQTDQMDSDVADVLSVFTDAAAHIPRHRRNKCYMDLVEALGPETFLARTCLLLIDRLGTKLVKADMVTVNEQLELPLTLVRYFGLSPALATIQRLSESAKEIAQAIEEARSEEQPSHVDRAQAASLYNILICLNSLLDDVAISKMIISGRSERSDVVFTTVSLALVKISSLRVIKRGIARDVNGSALRRSTAYLSPEALSGIATDLLQSKSSADIAIALTVVAQKLQTVKPARRVQLDAASAQALRVVCNAVTSGEPSKTELSTATVVVDTIDCDTHHGLVSDLASAMLERLPEKTLDSAICLSYLRLLKSSFERMPTRLIPAVTRAVAVGLELLCGRQQDMRIVTGAVSMLETIIRALPVFVAPQLPEFVNAIIFVDASDYDGAEDNMAALSACLAKHLDAGLMITSLLSIGHSLSDVTSKTLDVVLSLLRRVLRIIKPADLANLGKTVFRWMLEVFEVTSQKTSFVEQQHAAVGAFVQMVLKLSETTFRPIFMRLYDWAAVDLEPGKAYTNRNATFFEITSALVKNLKSIFVPQLAFVIDHSTGLLEGMASEKNLPHPALWTNVLETLTGAFQHDQTDFWSNTRLRKVAEPIVDQLNLASRLSKQQVHTALACIKQLGMRLENYEQAFAAHNKAMLVKTRSEDLLVRVAALQALEATWRQQGEALLPHVGETIPFLLEALEEPEEGVDKAARKLVTQIEAHLGESLNDYLS
ncbi:uncharacterized protein L969DRAFT_91903 [Mixia osmundae IAM 14324]|uniref:U3 small nucleolar RNA-associated protein 10 n=1 Tax=Mixia osmundae (strain CBS 9802 / IAM 14324 / JCM 22182 / KY 12970) TaxID=764103 RepID=G7E368_MIXOS|nr:uncharacterized protein L969DRAFT_91903 [Mixia osmundae IAM 14324]KEI42462.1 hypothetical protein L969DRAFT_91903 [Mixia osmundae IAM 14324]GAA97249.1 hypothetical protein E5Q_03926 [Mixia osmundae IAM 14324]